MAKAKGAAGSAAVANRPAYSRVSFLFQAAALLAGTQPPKSAISSSATTTTTAAAGAEAAETAAADGAEAAVPLQGMARRLLTQMRSVSRKTNMRVRPAMKHRVCKYCDTLLVEGTTCVSVVENHSRGGRKPWADVLTVTCTACGRARRYPVSAPRQPRRPARAGAAKDAGTGPEDGEVSGSDAAANQDDKPKTQQQQQQQPKKGKRQENQGKQGKKQDKRQHTVVVGRGKHQKPAGGFARKNGPG
ncbi:hypothetical protein SCUCBS95973_003541 [Sporothrix curviconia]|uniref:Uncharacterized protein n=1 Tax=Sporothrix curviconia TaxID=1260050 RepID=A0ABP0BH94_9PEZI